MSTVPSTLWDDVLGQVRLSHRALARGWFSDLTPISFDRGLLEIGTRNRAQSRYLEQHCQRAFVEAAQAATGRLVSVCFTVAEADSDSLPDPDPALDSTEQLLLIPDYTFDHFVTGPCNRLAHAAAMAIAKKPGRAYNPFFAYGATGLGKTHLLQAVCHAIRRNQSQARYLYISCETFTNHFIEAVEHGALHQFRYRYRHVDGLVIDDIQFLAERERSQEEFFHTFNALHQSQRQIILSADCSPAEIPSLEERLVSRFNSGLVALLDRPCLDTRMAIIRKKAKLRCIEVPEDVVRIIASCITTNIRELEGALIKVDALSQTYDGKITSALAREALGPEPTRPVQIPAILNIVAKHFNTRVTELQSKKRSKAVTQPRHVCMYLARKLRPHSLEQIGGYFGGRDHTTVLHASRIIAQQLEGDPQLRALIDQVTAEVKNASF